MSKSAHFSQFVIFWLLQEHRDWRMTSSRPLRHYVVLTSVEHILARLIYISYQCRTFIRRSTVCTCLLHGDVRIPLHLGTSFCEGAHFSSLVAPLMYDT